METVNSVSDISYERLFRRVDDPDLRDNRQLRRLVAVLDEPSAEPADADREFDRIRLPPWVTPFQAMLFDQLRRVYIKTARLQCEARTNCRGAADEAYWTERLNQAEERFDKAAALYWYLYPPITQ